MLLDAVTHHVAELDADGLHLLRVELARILDQRGIEDGESLFQWRSLSSLELAGVVAMLDLRIPGLDLLRPGRSRPS